MVLLTMIARLSDGLPLAASIEGNEEMGRTLVEYQNQAKQLFKKLNQSSPPKCSLNSNNYTFHILLDEGVIYLTLCENEFSKKLAFSYLDDLRAEFRLRYIDKIPRVTRPYTFIEFDNYIQKSKKSFVDSRSRRHLTHINTQLQDVQKIMVQNIDDVLQRGEALSMLDDKATHLSLLSQKYKKEAHALNLRSSYLKIGILLFLVLILCAYIRFWWF